MKIILLLAAFGITKAQARTLTCITDQLAWTKIQVYNAGTNSIVIKILDTVLNRREDIGATANLNYARSVNPNGRIFFNYRGEFIGGHPQKTLSIYLSKDNRTLTALRSGAYNYICQ